MTQSLHQYVVDELHNAKGTWPSIAEKTGISKRTIEKIASGEIRDPAVSNIEILANYFRALAAA